MSHSDHWPLPSQDVSSLSYLSSPAYTVSSLSLVTLCYLCPIEYKNTSLLAEFTLDSLSLHCQRVGPFEKDEAIVALKKARQ